jgi:hypothetical protein
MFEQHHSINSSIGAVALLRILDNGSCFRTANLLRSRSAVARLFCSKRRHLFADRFFGIGRDPPGPQPFSCPTLPLESKARRSPSVMDQKPRPSKLE